MTNTTVIQYSSNNSGGSWWLTTDDWKALERAGWNVEWQAPFLGASAKYATRTGLSLDEAIREWEVCTDQHANARGCPCCGQPHNFYELDSE